VTNLNFLNPLAGLAALACENSDVAAGIVRKLEFRGKRRIAQRTTRAKSGHEVVATCSGIRYKLDLRDDLQRELYFNIYDREDIQYALTLLRPGGVCLDVGANNGTFALNFARAVGGSGMVHAFEADGQVFARLQANCRLNKAESVVRCRHAAITSVSGPVEFYSSSSSHSGWGSVVEFQDIAEQKQTVTGITLDDFLLAQNIRHVDILKADIEAHEPEMLRGAQESLADHVFCHIIIEFNGLRLAQRGKSIEDLLAPLESAGYRAMEFRLKELQRVRDGSIPAETVCTNFFFSV